LKTVIYRFADGTASEVEVEDELYAELERMDKEDKKNERRETRRHISLSKLTELGIEPTVTDEYDGIDPFGKIRDDELYDAIHNLDCKQKGLLYRVYYEQVTLKEMAEEEKVSSAAICMRLRTILSQLRIKR